MAGVAYLIPLVGIVAACAALCVSRASFYRAKAPPKPRQPRPRPPRGLDEAERAEVLAVLDSDRFADKAPAQVYAELLDEERYLCSIRGMYRVLAAAEQVRERRDQRRHPTYVKPQLEARAPNQVWTWDITKVPGPVRGVYYSLYVVIDIFSRYVVAWTVALTESAAIAQQIIDAACVEQRIVPGQLTVHSDRGSPMTAKSTAQFFVDLGIIQSHSRPSVSDDNPFSEAAFKTFLYRPGIPDRFGSIEDARSYFADLLRWYNEEHYHSGIALLTPGDVHRGTAPTIIARRQVVLDAAHRAHPERFVHGTPVHPTPPTVVWINPPMTAMSTTTPAPPPAATPLSSPTQRGPQREAPLVPEADAVDAPPRARTASRGRPTSDRPPALARAKPRQPAASQESLH
jgi:putative transposase